VLGFLNRAAVSGTYRVPGLLLQRHNEHVIVPIRFAALVSKAVTGSVDFRFLVFLGNASLVLLIVLLWREFPADRRFACLPCVYLLFQVQYWENTLIATCAVENLWGPCLAFAAFVVLNRKGPCAAAGAIGLAALAMCTLGNGVLVLPIGLLMLLCRREYRTALVWSVALLPFLWLVLARTGTGHAMAALAHPLASLHWFLVFLGSSVGHVFLPPARDSPLAHGLSLAWGLVIVAVFIYMTATRHYDTSAPVSRSRSRPATSSSRFCSRSSAWWFSFRRPDHASSSRPSPPPSPWPFCSTPRPTP